MTVIGSLEDLSFPDILQVVHVSRQSGTLVLSGPRGERRVRFRNGLVCGATLGERGPELEDLLVQRGLVGAAALDAARQRSHRTAEPISSALVALGAVSQETIESVVRDELRTIVRSLVLLQEGEFRFEMDGAAPSAGDLGLSQGLGPDSILQGLPVRGGTRTARGRRPEAAARQGRTRALIVVERSILRLTLRDELVRCGFQVEVCGTASEALLRAPSLTGDGRPLSLVCDLMLPAGQEGGGWRGGIDLVRRVRALAPDLTAIIVGEVRDPEIAREARAAGTSAYLLLPDLADAGLDGVAERLGRFCAEVRETLDDPERPAQRQHDSEAGSVRVVDQLSLLRGLIGEMRAEEESGIPLLVLRLAAEYFERGVLFAVRDGGALGAGAFGGADDGASSGLDTRIRGVTLPLQRGSVLQQAAQGRDTYIGPIAASRPNAPLLEKLGAPAPGEAALLPLLSGRHVFGILYGDNARSGRPVGDLKALEIFLSQAGIALENAFLQRRIASLAGSGSREGRGPASHA